MSVVFDSLWWWRSEFGGTSHPYLQTETSKDAISPSPKPLSATLLPSLDQGLAFLNDTALDFAQVPDWLLDVSGGADWSWDANYDWNSI